MDGVATDAAVLPLGMPCLTQAGALLARALGRARPPVSFGAVKLAFGPAPATLAPHRVFGLRIGGEDAAARVPDNLATVVLSAVDPALAGLDSPMIPLLLEMSLEPLLRRLEAAFPAMTVALGHAVQPFDGAEVGLRCDLGGTVGEIALTLGPAAALALAAALAGSPGEGMPLPGLTVPLTVRALAADVLVADMQALRPGNVVLAEPPDAGVALLVAGDRFGWRVARDGRCVRVTGGRQDLRAAGLEGWTMTASAAGEIEGGPEEDAADLADLPVRLVFDVGRLEMPLGGLEAVGPGYVFELGRGPSHPMDILANGRTVGTREMVRIGEAVGVRVLQIGRRV